MGRVFGSVRVWWGRRSWIGATRVRMEVRAWRVSRRRGWMGEMRRRVEVGSKEVMKRIRVVRVGGRIWGVGEQVTRKTAGRRRDVRMGKVWRVKRREVMAEFWRTGAWAVRAEVVSDWVR